MTAQRDWTGSIGSEGHGPPIQERPSAIMRLAAVGLGTRVAVTAMAMLNIVLLAVWLQPAGYGIYAIFVRSLSLLTMIGELGIGQSAMAHFSLAGSIDARLHRSFLRIVALASLATCGLAAIAVAIGGGLMFQGLPRPWLWLLVATLPATIYANFWSGMMIGAGDIWRLNLVRLATAALFLAGTCLFVVALGGGVPAALLSYFAVMSLQLLFMIGITRGRARAGGDEAVPSARRLAAFGLRGYASPALYLVWTTLPLFALNAVHGAAAAGIFALGVQLVEKLLLPAQSLYEAVYKQMGRLGPSKAADEAVRYATLIAAATTLTILASAPAAYFGTPVLLGAAYREAGAVAALLMLGAPLTAIMLVLDSWFVNALRRPGLASALAALNVAVAAMMTALLLPHGGTIGAAAALLMTQAIGSAITLALFKRLSESRGRHLLCTATDTLIQAWMWSRRRFPPPTRRR